MLYNRAETVYHKAAKRLLHAGRKITGEENILACRAQLPCLDELGFEELGFEVEPNPNRPPRPEVNLNSVDVVTTKPEQPYKPVSKIR